MTDGIIYYKKKKLPDSIGEALKGHFDRPKKKVCAYEWQDKAFDIANKLSIDFKKNKRLLPNWLSLFKRAFNSGRSGRLDKCYSFVVDYIKPLDDTSKVKLFFWRYGFKEDKK
jgi:hypothetical protein